MNSPEQLYPSPDGRYLAVIDSWTPFGQERLVILDVTDPLAPGIRLSRSFGAGLTASDVVIDPDSQLAYVSMNPGSGNTGTSSAITAYSLDWLIRQDTRSIDTGTSVLAGLAVDPLGGKLYATDSATDELLEIRTSVPAITRRSDVSGGTHPAGPGVVAVNATSSIIATANLIQNTVAILDPISFVRRSSVPADGRPNALAIDPLGRSLYILNSGGNTLTRHRLQPTDIPLSPIRLDGHPTTLAIRR